jgi:Anti-sigma-K factor rskA
MNGPTRPHDHIEQLIVAQVLDGLDPDELEQLRNEMAEHGPACPECIRLTTAYREVAARLALSLEPEPLSAGAEERLVQAARTAPPITLRPMTDRRAAAQAPTPAPSRPWRPSAVAATASVAAAVALIVGLVVGYLAAPNGGFPEDVRIVAFSAVNGQQLSLALEEGTDRGWVLGSGLRDPGEGRVYELWFRETGTEEMQPAGIFTPRDGSVLEEVELAPSVDLVAVTIERRLEQQPTTEPIFVAEVAPPGQTS